MGAPAVEAQALKIGFVNFGRLLEESPQAKAAQPALEAEFLPRQRDVAAQQKSLQEKSEKLTKEAAVMSEADRLRTEREVRDLELNVNAATTSCRKTWRCAATTKSARRSGAAAGSPGLCPGERLPADRQRRRAVRGGRRRHHAAGRGRDQVQGAGSRDTSPKP